MLLLACYRLVVLCLKVRCIVLPSAFHQFCCANHVQLPFDSTAFAAEQV